MRQASIWLLAFATVLLLLLVCANLAGTMLWEM
jgi:hypothetical protein